MNDLVSLIIPSRCEKYLQPTIDTAIENARGNIEIIPVIDGQYEKGKDGYDPKDYLPLKQHPNVKPIYLNDSIGQRAGYNLGVKHSNGNYIIKIDGHCILCPEWDTILVEQIKQHDFCTTIIPEMRRLDVEKWEFKPRGVSHFMYFGTDLFCHYWREYKKRPESKDDLVEVLTGQGSCWFIRREWHDYIGGLDERCGSWGKVGIEISLKTWLLGGKQLVSKKAWQAHYFRVHEGGFPYSISGRKIRKAKEYAFKNWYFKNDAFPKQIRSFSWLLKKFAPVPGWEVYNHDEYKHKRAIIYISDDSIEDSLANAVRKTIEKSVGFIPIISISDKKLDFGKNFICKNENGRNDINIYRKLLVGLENTDADYIYVCEHDVFYHSSHFVFIPPDDNFYHNKNSYYWKIGLSSYMYCGERNALSQLVVKREVLLKHCKERIQNLLQNKNAKIKYKLHFFESEKPNIDVRHDNNLSKDGKKKKKYYSEKSENNITNIAYWGSVSHMMKKASYKGYTRTDIINYLIEQNNYKSYLEIGVLDGKHFHQIKCEYKVCVDPSPKNFDNENLYKITSDEFFEKYNGEKFDIIFIDGLHESKQVKRDTNNSLKLLNNKGVITIHDCNPESELQQRVPRPKRCKIWIGDGWKSFLHFRQEQNLNSYVVQTNNGVGIIKKEKNLNPLIIENSINLLTYNDLDNNRKQYLNLQSVEKFKQIEKK